MDGYMSAMILIYVVENMFSAFAQRLRWKEILNHQKNTVIEH